MLLWSSNFFFKKKWCCSFFWAMPNFNVEVFYCLILHCVDSLPKNFNNQIISSTLKTKTHFADVVSFLQKLQIKWVFLHMVEHVILCLVILAIHFSSLVGCEFLSLCDIFIKEIVICFEFLLLLTCCFWSLFAGIIELFLWVNWLKNPKSLKGF